MARPLVVIITGLPCTGKTTLGRRIATEFSLPFVGRDDLKELLFDSLGWSDRAWSRRLGAASYELLYYSVTLLLSAKQSFVIESNFRRDLDEKRFLDLRTAHDFEPFQVRCYTDGEMLVQRFKRRSESGERHPGHVDHLNFDEYEPGLRDGGAGQLEIGGQFLEVDTTDFETIDYPSLFAAIGEVARKL